MDKKQQMNLSFDPKADVLYCSFGEAREAIGVELENGEVIRLDPETDEVIGITVVDFTKRALQEGTLSLPIGKQKTLTAS